ncbi:MAG: hypothetical protein Q8P49_00165 [Candidatus Liptonbacteria bacterium]|nr:hypothetical protein [Candidatus Liptonbacteria bacterium]
MDAWLDPRNDPGAKKPLSVEQEETVSRCKAVLDGILALNYERYASIVIFPLSDPQIRWAIYDHYVGRYYQVGFFEAGNSGLVWIDLRGQDGGRRVAVPNDTACESKAMSAHA